MKKSEIKIIVYNIFSWSWRSYEQLFNILFYNFTRGGKLEKSQMSKKNSGCVLFRSVAWVGSRGTTHWQWPKR